MEGSLANVALAFAVSSVACFVVSIILASYLVLYLPTLVELLPESSDQQAVVKPLWLTEIPFWPFWKVDTYATWQLRIFVAGLLLFTCTFVTMAIRA